MGSKPWHKLTALAAFSFLVVGCNNTPQKSADIKGPPPTGQAGQYNLPPMSGQQPFPTQTGASTIPPQPNPQFAPTSNQGFNPNPMTPPPKTINNSSPQPYTGGSSFQPIPSSAPSSPNFPGSPGVGGSNPPLGGGPQGFPPSMNSGPNPPLGGNFADQRPGPIP